MNYKALQLFGIPHELPFIQLILFNNAYAALNTIRKISLTFLLYLSMVFLF